MQDEKRKYYRLMFHPEVVYTHDGAQLIRNFVRKVAGLAGDCTIRAFREEAIEKIRAQVSKGKVICGLSGGVDSAVAPVLLHESIGDQLTCVFVDHGRHVCLPVLRPAGSPARQYFSVFRRRDSNSRHHDPTDADLVTAP
jgi:asparagine synthetase B (glutamine-hydrolysing)